LRDSKQKPNVIILYADDLGYGDVSCYGAHRLSTPNIDRLAKDGQLFWQGYATASTCTPSRYSLLTGSYPWRNPRASILRGDAPQIIPTGSPTLPAMFKNAGYSTGIVGKWHLGLGEGDLDWNSPSIQGTPNDLGFDSSYILAATNDRTPCVYINNRHVDNLDANDPLEVTYDREHPFTDIPTVKTHPELQKIVGHTGCLIHGIPRIGYMRGGNKALWDDETMCDVFLNKAHNFMTENKNHPFFLYYAFHEPHAPRIPSPRFAGSTDLGPRGDVIVELDWCVGQILDQLESLGLREDTIVIFSSDNGPVLWDVYEDNSIELANGHEPAGPLRGGKYSSFDGGTRVPFIVSWPGTISPGESDAIVCQMDFHASFASMLEQELVDGEAPDSLNILDALLGQSSLGREELVVEGHGKNTILRSNNWTYLPPKDGPEKLYNGIEAGNSSKPQLYELSQDIGQMKELASTRPEVVSELETRLQAILKSEQTR